MSRWIDRLTDEQKRACGLMPDQMRERFSKQLALLQGDDIVQTKECRELQGALRAALRRLGKTER